MKIEQIEKIKVKCYAVIKELISMFLRFLIESGYQATTLIKLYSYIVRLGSVKVRRDLQFFLFLGGMSPETFL